MVEIDKPIISTSIYRYRSIDSKNILRELEAIVKQSIFLSTFDKMNDPMEGFYQTSSRLGLNSNYRRISDDISRRKFDFGMCCFSESQDNELMWVHYARNYSGICIGYTTSGIISGLNDKFHLIKISYGRNPPKLSSNDTEDYQAAARKILSHKKASWSYEREWRILGPKNLQTISSKKAVRSVYIGPNMNDKFKKRIEKKLMGTNIKIYSMIVSEYEHDWKPGIYSR